MTRALHKQTTSNRNKVIYSTIGETKLRRLNNEKSLKRGLFRRAIPAIILAVIIIATVTPAIPASARDTWFFTAEELAAAHEYQERYGERLRNPLRGGGCFLGRQEFTATYRRTAFEAPCRFINEVARHLKEMLIGGAAQYLFPLDADHAHLAVPSEVWMKKYRKLSADQIIAALFREPTLVALYHTAEHLDINDPKTGQVNEKAKAWREKRNVLAFFDGRPIQILPPHPDGYGISMPAEYQSYGGINFLANPRGELFLFLDNKMITFDMSLEIEEYNEWPGVAQQIIRANPR